MILQRILEAPKQSFFLLGPRGSGKSTWLRVAFPDAHVIDLLSEEVQVPAIRGLAQEGAVGLMCVRTACDWRPGGGYLTLGAGARAGYSGLYGRDAALEGASYHVDEVVDGRSAGRLFSLYTGWPVGDNRLLHTRARQRLLIDLPVDPFTAALHTEGALELDNTLETVLFQQFIKAHYNLTRSFNVA